MVSHKYGKGECIYAAGDLGGTFTAFRVADVKQMVWNLLKQVTDPYLTIENAYETVEVILRMHTECELLHFVNYTGAMSRPIQSVIACRGILVKLRKNTPVKRVYALWSEQELAFEQKNGVLSFSVDLCGVYEVIVIE